MNNTPQSSGRIARFVRFLRYAGAAVAAAAVATCAAYLMTGAEARVRAKAVSGRELAEKDFQKKIKELVSNSKCVCDDSFILMLKGIAAVDKTPEHRSTINEALAEVFANRLEVESNPKKREELAAATIKYYREILPELESRKRNEVSRKLAIVLMEQKKWDEGAKIFKESEGFQMTPTERWSNRLSWATCLWRDSKTLQALDLLSQIVDECDNMQLRGRALRLKADILLLASSSTEDAAQLAGASEFTGAAERPSILVDKAFKLYGTVVKLLPSLNEDVSVSQLGMLRILIDEGKKDDAYEVANNIQFGGGSVNDKIRALVLIAEMEEKEGDLLKASEVLATCKKKFSQSILTDELAFKLYQLMLKNGKYDDAFDLCEEILTKYQNIGAMETVLKGFFPGKEGLIDNLDFADPEKMYRTRTVNVLKSLETRSASVWQRLMPLALTARAFLNYHLGQCGRDAKTHYELAEKGFAELFENRKDIELLAPDDSMYCDLMSAVQVGRDPAVVAFRARRYLSEYPISGRHSRDSLQILMGAYYQMGLYDQAFDIARNVFIEQVSQMGDAAKPDTSDEWLKTVAKIGQCYDKLGQYEKANTILRNYAKRFLSRPFAAQIYYDWAGVASARGQKHEAIRRYDVAYLQAGTADLRYQIILERSLLSLELKEDGCYPEALILLRGIASDSALKDETRKMMQRRLYEALLEYTSANNPQEFERLFGEALANFKSETWPEYWVLRSFTPMFGKVQLSEISKKHKDMLDNEFLKMSSKTSETFSFLKRQLELIQKQIGVEGELSKLKNRGL